MSKEMQRNLITLTSTLLAGILASQLAEKFVDVPEERGVRDDLKEAVLQAGFSVVATVGASILVRRVVGSRWK